MNLFILSQNPQTAAAWLDNRRITKMTVETHQMASVALRKWGYKDAPYADTHVHHPVTQWVCHHPRNCAWALQYAACLIQERLNAGYFVEGSHIAQRKLVNAFRNMPHLQTYWFERPQLFQNSAANAEHNLDFKSLTDTVSAYQQYLIARWRKEHAKGFKPRWRRETGIPPFIAIHEPTFAMALRATEHEPLPAHRSKPATLPPGVKVYPKTRKLVQIKGVKNV